MQGLKMTDQILWVNGS